MLHYDTQITMCISSLRYSTEFCTHLNIGDIGNFFNHLNQSFTVLPSVTNFGASNFVALLITGK